MKEQKESEVLKSLHKKTKLPFYKLRSILGYD